jgi:hypothetical protein
MVKIFVNFLISLSSYMTLGRRKILFSFLSVWKLVWKYLWRENVWAFTSMSALLHTACPTADLKTFPPCQSWILKRNKSKIGTNINTSRKHDLKLFIWKRNGEQGRKQDCKTDSYTWTKLNEKN